jgi:integrase
MRGCDLITTGETWEYRPSRHKTQHRGKTRVVFLGPKAQSIIHQFLKTDMQEFLFSPRDVVNELNARKRANRKSPMTPSQSNRCQKAKPKRRPGERYTKDSYRIVIQRACKKADVPKWHPNQLRHNAGTELRRRYGIEAARTVLGHTSAATTEIYAELDMEKAKRIIGEVG